MPIAWNGTVIQYAGRLHRAHPRKREILIYDYVDKELPVLRRMFTKRLRTYRSLGYELADDGVSRSPLTAWEGSEYLERSAMLNCCPPQGWRDFRRRSVDACAVPELPPPDLELCPQSSPSVALPVPSSDIIAEVRNPDGHLVQLDQAAWDHVIEQHIEMSDYLAEAMAAITALDAREPDIPAGRGRYFHRGGPLRWIRIVTELSGSQDRVVTAFPQSNDPRSAVPQR
jgi:hypothetical protein